MDAYRRNLGLLAVGQFVALMGDAVFTGAVAWLAKSLTERDDAVGLVVFLSTLPWLVIGPFAGALVDRVDRRRVMVASDIVRAALLATLWVFAWRGDLTFALLAGAAFLVQTASTPFVPARDALLPVLAGGRPLVRFNAAFQVTTQLAALTGLWLGGVLLGTDPADRSAGRVVNVLAIGGITYLVSAATLAAMALPRAVPAARTGTGTASTLWGDAVRGVRDTMRDPLLLPLLVLTALDNLAIMGPAIVGAVGYVRDDLGLAAGHWAWFEGTMALGYLVGALAIARFGTRARKGRLILWGMLFDGLTYVPFFWVRSYPLALTLIFFHGFFIPWIVVGRTALVQEHVPAERRGRVFALVNLTVQGMTALSALLAGWIAVVAGAPSLFLVAGVFGTACGVVGLLAIPRLRDAT